MAQGASLTTVLLRPRFRTGPAVLLTTALVTMLGGPVMAHAFERVTLRNGFTYDCARDQAIDRAHTRLFLSEQGNSSYVDVPTTDIVAVIAMPAPLPVPGPAREGLQASPAKVDVPTLLSSAGLIHDIDVDLLASLVHAESNGHSRAVSRTGAQGLMQLMPSTARHLGVVDSFAPDQNINGGTSYLDWLLRRYHDNLALALAAYNAGPAAVDRYHGIPPFRETRAYVVRVMTEFKQRKAALASAHPAATLQASR